MRQGAATPAQSFTEARKANGRKQPPQPGANGLREVDHCRSSKKMFTLCRGARLTGGDKEESRKEDTGPCSRKIPVERRIEVSVRVMVTEGS